MQLGARASCAGRPRVLSTLRAARSRSQRGALRAVAYPAESSPAAAAAAAAAAVAELRQLVTRPRLNKQLVQKQVQVVESNMSVLVKDAALARKDSELKEKELQELVRDYLEVQGMLHARGLLEYAGEKLLAPLSPTAKQDRRSKWQQLGQRHPELQESILKANPSWKAHFIPDKVVQLYSHLSAQVHPGDLSRTGKVLLVEGPLNREEINLLERLARAVHCPYEVRYKHPPAAIERGEQPAAGTEGE